MGRTVDGAEQAEGRRGGGADVRFGHGRDGAMGRREDGVGGGRGGGVDGERIALPVQRLRPDAILPAYATRGDAGLDLAIVEDVALAAGARAAAPTGLAVAVPEGWVGLVHPRSGLAIRDGVTVVNAPGTIDAGYRGEVRVLLINLGDRPVQLRRGERVAQLVLQRVGVAEVVEVDRLDETERGVGGFGSTGR